MKKKYLVEVWEHRQVSFEVEAENKEEAKKVAEDTYQNDEELQHEMVANDESVVYEEVKVLHEIGPATGIVDEKPSSKPERNPELYAVITIKDSVVHLDYTVNPDASCCQENEDILQLETYPDTGWCESKFSKRLEDDFWGVWTDWNGHVTGGIVLQDDFTFAEWDRMVSRYREVTPAEIKDLEDGGYVVYAEMKQAKADDRIIVTDLRLVANGDQWGAVVELQDEKEVPVWAVNGNEGTPPWLNDEKEYERWYNLALEEAHRLGYWLEGEVQ